MVHFSRCNNKRKAVIKRGILLWTYGIGSVSLPSTPPIAMSSAAQQQRRRRFATIVREFGHRILPYTGLLKSRRSLAGRTLGASGAAQEACLTHTMHLAGAYRTYHTARVV